ncbi:MAG: HTTM domain-containing protein [Flammeovirgaceae bacterium]
MWQKLFRPIDIAPLIFFRVFAGGLITIEKTGELFTNYHRDFVIGDFHFSYFFFQWLEPWPPMGVYIHMGFNVLIALCVTLGLYYRWTTILMFLSTSSMFLMEKAVYINHTYLYSLFAFLLIFMPANRAWSLDVKRNPSIATGQTPAWTVYLILFQMSVVYFFAGIAKVNPDWFQAQPMTIWLSSKKHFYIIGPILTSAIWPYVVSYGGVLFDLFIVPALLWKRTRLYAFIISCCFHLINVCTFGIGTFPWLSAVVTALFFAPESFRKLKFLDRNIPKFQPSTAPVVGKPWVKVFIVTYVAIQLLVPMRQWIYPGNTSWTEYGHNFSWHMMLRSKRGSTMFTVKDPDSGKEWKEDPFKRLTRKQSFRMVGKPDMILEYAHYLAELYREKGHPNVEVYVDARVKLNARKKQRMIDPTVDLAKESWSLLPYSWVIPLEDGDIVYKN